VIERMGQVIVSWRHALSRIRRVARLARHPVKPGDIVLLGDSITETGAWPEWFPDLPVRNYGVSGDTTRGVRRRLGPVAHHPTLVLLMIGTNDIGSGADTDTVLAEMASILATLARRSPDTKVIVQSVLPRSTELAPAIQRFNRGLDALCQRAHVEFLDLYPIFADPQGAIDGACSDDELHLLPAGYARWLTAIRPLVVSTT
jgi:lysophospholipase L1-like esterase